VGRLRRRLRLLCLWLPCLSQLHLRLLLRLCLLRPPLSLLRPVKRYSVGKDCYNGHFTV
jgi:hypothetical protein